MGGRWGADRSCLQGAELRRDRGLTAFWSRQAGRGDQSRPGTAGALVETRGLRTKGRRGTQGGGRGQRGQLLDLGTPAENGGLYTLVCLEGRGCLVRQSLSREQAQEVEPGPRSLRVNQISNEGLSLAPKS